MADNRPAWYILDCAGFTRGVVKHGTTRHVATRKDGYRTAHEWPVKYRRVFFLDPDHPDVAGAALYLLDSVAFPAWLGSRGRGGDRVSRGGGTEFYAHGDDAATLAREFFGALGVAVTEELSDDPYPYPSGSRSAAALGAEDDVAADAVAAAAVACAQPRRAREVTKAAFCATLNGGAPLRAHQDELWDEWAATLQRLRGAAGAAWYETLVCWPTGSGKTIASLVLILLAAAAERRAGRPYCGLFVAPTNDIIDTATARFTHLAEFGVRVVDGQRGAFSRAGFDARPSRECPDVVVVTTHAAMARSDFAAWAALPRLTHVHYDEVHRVTGANFHANLRRCRAAGGAPLVTGTSATPLTSCDSQNAGLAELFGDPLRVVHYCSYGRAIACRWVAVPRFWLRALGAVRPDSDDEAVAAVVAETAAAIDCRRRRGLWRGRKCIVFCDTIAETTRAEDCARAQYPAWRTYAAVDGAAAGRRAADFVAAGVADFGSADVLFACDRYREGADVAGLELTAVLLGAGAAPHTLVQIAGRALRADYPEKEGWCVVVRRGGGDITDAIGALVATAFGAAQVFGLGEPGGAAAMVAGCVKVVAAGAGDAVRELTVDETVGHLNAFGDRVAARLAAEAAAAAAPPTYAEMRRRNVSRGVRSRDAYEATRDQPPFVDNPEAAFGALWVTWYDFFGIDREQYPPTIDAWAVACRRAGATTRETYRKKIAAGELPGMPAEPADAYAGFTSWRALFPPARGPAPREPP